MLTAKQKEERRLGVGGSDMPIILGVSSYKTPYQLYLEKIGESTKEDPETQYQYWGNVLEPIIRREFEKRNDVKVECPATIVHPLFPFLRANVDGYIKSLNAVLEIKNVNQFMAKEWGEIGDNTIPFPYLVQVAHYCACLNADGAYLAVLIGGNDYREYYYKRDDEIEDYIIDEAIKFWRCVQDRKPPEPINQSDVNLIYPTTEKGKQLIISSAMKSTIEKMSKSKEKIKEAKKIEDDLKMKITSYMGDAESLIDNEGNILATWKENRFGTKTFNFKG